MVLFKHEMKQSVTMLSIWTIVISFMLAVCVLIYPEMKSQMNEISSVFSEMGNFSAAFGMDQINFGEFMGYFGVECGNVLGMGGAFFAALIGVSALVKEEKERTSEFLLAHPISRRQVVLEKFLAVLVQILVLNVVVAAATFLSVLLVGESPEWGKMALLFLVYLFLQIQIAFVCFGISAFLQRGGLGIGLGLAAMLYFLNIIANLTEQAEFLKYFTPFGYANSALIMAEGRIDIKLLLVGALFAVAGIAMSFFHYCKKDIS